ncbi:hypothetical protein B0H14DRAFT_2890852 [Mycena olivaceomarginata]|nr:hypothetical protein B0H14DRAFT_2890852 [Mycena olivaceomarginata]
MGHRKSNVDVFIAAYLTDWNAPTFNGQPHEDARMWLRKIRTGLKLHAVPPALWVPIAFHFLGDEPRVVLDGREVQEGRGEWEWEWDRFTRALIHIHDRVKKDAENESSSIGDDFHRFRREHPYAAAAAGLGLVAVGGITVGPAILVGTLNLLGFSSAGVVGGSIAAGIQSAVYGAAVGSGSLFAMTQSAAAGGVAVAPVAIQALSAAAMALGAWVGFGRGEDDTPPAAPAAQVSLEDEQSN